MIFQISTVIFIKDSPKIIHFLVILFDIKDKEKKSYRDKGNGATEPFFDVFMNKFHNAEFGHSFKKLFRLLEKVLKYSVMALGLT